MHRTIILQPGQLGVVPSATELRQAGFHVATSVCLLPQNNSPLNSSHSNLTNPPTSRPREPSLMAKLLKNHLRPD